jgi:arylsulfatase A-like enzyme
MARNALRLAPGEPFPLIYRRAIFLIPGILLLIGCSNPPVSSDRNAPVPSRNSQSLLLSTPFIGEETTVRNPAPQPVRVQLGDESVEGWLAPSEKVLRFPVDLKDGCKLSFRLGIAAGPYRPVSSEMPPPGMRVPPPGRGGTPVPPSGPSTEHSLTVVPQTVSTALPEFGDLSLKVEFAPTGQDGKPRGQLSIVYELPAEDFTKATREWLLVDLPLDEIAPSKGELRFVADGPRAGSEDFQVLWGQPALHVPRREAHRNILLIGVDTLREDAISPLGGRPEVTPNIQAFSENATVFTQVHAQAPWTLPSFASIVTGLMPSRAVVMGVSSTLSENNKTVGGYLLPEGLSTFTVCSSPWLGNENSGFQQGMEGFSFIETATAQLQVAAAMKFIARSEEMDRDWFCFVHLMDPHAPYEPPEKYIEQFCDPDYKGRYPTNSPVGAWDNVEQPSQEEIDHERCLYDCEVANVDSALQDLFDFLDEKGITEDTLIIFCSDHGEEFNEHGGFEHGRTHYEEQVHVPLIVKGPGFPARKRVDTCVANLDILPTILRYLDIAQPGSLGGVPLQDTLVNENKNDRVVMGEETMRGTPLIYSMQWPYKCILNYNTGESKLFDLVNDPGETVDVGSAHIENSNTLRTALGLLMRPANTAIHVWISGYEQEEHKFTGSIKIPGGIDKVQTFLFDSEDKYSVSGDTLEFSISSLVNQRPGMDNLMPRGVTIPHLPLKHLVITPLSEAETIEASVMVDGAVSPDRFFPFGNMTAEPSGSATVNIASYPMIPAIPQGRESISDSLIIWGVLGTHTDKPPAELDPQTLEQLKALGYVN